MRKLFLLFSVMWVSCGDPVQKAAPDRPINPNGDSELALLMREMFDEGERVKAQVMRGEQPSGLRDFTAIHSAIPTDSTVRTPVFAAFSEAYLQSVRQLELSDSASVFRFNAMVDQCMNCHSEFCPGPRKRIRKLYITD